MTQQQIFEWLEHPERLNRETLCELRTLLARYPYFQTARLLYLKNLFLLHDPSFSEELRKAALYVSDRKMLFYLIEGERFSSASLEVKERPKEEGLDRTLSLIDSFLATLPDEPAVPLGIPMDVTTDYTSLLLKDDWTPEENVPQLRGQELIDEFIGKQQEAEREPTQGIGDRLEPEREFAVQKSWKTEQATDVDTDGQPEVDGQPAVRPAPDKEPEFQPNLPFAAEPETALELAPDVAVRNVFTEGVEAAESESATGVLPELPETGKNVAGGDEEMDEESYFTETLAKIYVKQQRYSKALEIIKKLNLKYPKKNAYFADQIRFLEKLIINTKSK